MVVELATAAAAGAENSKVSNRMNGITKIKTATINFLLFNTYA